MRNSLRSASRLGLLGAGVTILTAVAIAGFSISPASAAGKPQISREDYGYESWACGYRMQVEGNLTIKFSERADPHGSELPLNTQQLKFSETWTNSAGDSFGLSVTQQSKDLKITSAGGSVYEVTTQITGQPQTISSADGTVLARDRGNLRYTLRVDLATGSVDFLGASANGPHPGFGNDLCKTVAPLVGTTSAQHHTPRPLGTTDASMGYYEYLPPSYADAGGTSPLLIVTNGYGENGDGSAVALDNLLGTGIPRFIDVGGWPLDRPFVVLSTQHVEQPPGLANTCQDPWFGSCIMQLQHDLGHPAESPCTTPAELHAFIDYARSHYDVDPARVYVTGLSCGAFGIWEYLAEYGDQQVAAAVPIAGEGRPAWAASGCGLLDVPIWAIHGQFDDVVNPDGSVVPITSLKECPGATPEAPKLSIYPAGHESWDQAFSGSEGDDIYSWMLAFAHD